MSFSARSSQGPSQLRHTLLELIDRFFPVLVGRLLVLEEVAQKLHEAVRLLDRTLEDNAPVLHKDSLIRSLKNGVLGGVALFELSLHLPLKVIVGVLGLPITVVEVEFILDGSIHTDAPVAHIVLLDKGPSALLAYVLQHALKGGAHGALVRGADLIVLFQLGVILLDYVLVGAEVDLGHAVGCAEVGIQRVSRWIVKRDPNGSGRMNRAATGFRRAETHRHLKWPIATTALDLLTNRS